MSWLMWFAVIGGGVVTVAMTFILYMEKAWPHVLGVTVLAVLIGTLLFTISVLDRPFVGPLGIEAAPFEQALSVFNDVDHGN